MARTNLHKMKREIQLRGWVMEEGVRGTGRKKGGGDTRHVWCEM